MPLQRKTSSALPVPADNSPIPAPKLIFGTQSKNPSFPTGGLHSTGSIKFSLNNNPMVELAKAAFTQYSKYKTDADALNTFLFALSVTSNFEGGFDSVNTYDKAGISIGFIQFARPEAGAGRLLTLIGRNDLADKIKTQFGIKDPHASPAALLARYDASLIKDIITAISTPDGIKVQLAMAINQNVESQFYFDNAYTKALELKLNDPFAKAMLFDAAVNMGAGTPKTFRAPSAGQTDGDWISANTILFTRPERKVKWVQIVKNNFA